MTSNYFPHVALVCVLVFQTASFSQRTNSQRLPRQTTVTAVFTQSVWLDTNRIKINLNNRGGLDWNQYGEAAFWPDIDYNVYNSIVFDCGPWVIGKLNGVPSMGLSQWGSTYSPGPILNGQAAMVVDPADSLRYRPYRIGRGDTPESNPDYKEWPTDFGAPVDVNGKPRLYGDQTVWTVFNDMDSSAPWPIGFYAPVPRLPVEIQQAAYARSQVGKDTSALLANVVFLEWTIVNRGDAPIESTYVSLWTDIDFNDGDFHLNLPAIDTVNQLGYCWQGQDWAYGPPRAVGFVWLYGPAVPSTGGTAIFKGQTRADLRNLPLSSFWGIQDDSWPDASFYGPAYSMKTAWNIARGFDKVGNQILDSVTHQVTRFPYSGDPVSGTGWLCRESSGGAGFNLFSGPFTLVPHDTQWVMTALVPSTSNDRLECVRLLRQYAATLRSMSYDDIILTSVFGASPTFPSTVQLLQNYPNPFNPSTTIRYALPQRSHVTLTVFNTLGQQVATLVNETQEPGYHDVRFDASGLASGVYFYRLQGGESRTTKRLLLIR